MEPSIASVCCNVLVIVVSEYLYFFNPRKGQKPPLAVWITSLPGFPYFVELDMDAILGVTIHGAVLLLGCMVTLIIVLGPFVFAEI